MKTNKLYLKSFVIYLTFIGRHGSLHFTESLKYISFIWLKYKSVYKSNCKVFCFAPSVLVLQTQTIFISFSIHSIQDKNRWYLWPSVCFLHIRISCDNGFLVLFACKCYRLNEFTCKLINSQHWKTVRERLEIWLEIDICSLRTRKAMMMVAF